MLKHKVTLLVHKPGLRSRNRSRSRKESKVFGWSRSGIPKCTGRRSRIFMSDFASGCVIGSFLTSHSRIGNSCWNGAISFETFVETEISCCVPWFPVILTATFHFHYVKESDSGVGVGNFGRSETDSLPPTLQPWHKLQSKSYISSVVFVINLNCMKYFLCKFKNAYHRPRVCICVTKKHRQRCRVDRLSDLFSFSSYAPPVYSVEQCFLYFIQRIFLSVKKILSISPMWFHLIIGCCINAFCCSLLSCVRLKALARIDQIPKDLQCFLLVIRFMLASHISGWVLLV